MHSLRWYLIISNLNKRFTLCVYFWISQKDGMIFLLLELQAVVIHQKWELGTEHISSAKLSSALNHWLISAGPLFLWFSKSEMIIMRKIYFISCKLLRLVFHTVFCITLCEIEFLWDSNVRNAPDIPKNYFLSYSIMARLDTFFISHFPPDARKVKAKGNIWSLSDPELWVELSLSLFIVFCPQLLCLYLYYIICVENYFEKMNQKHNHHDIF